MRHWLALLAVAIAGCSQPTAPPTVANVSPSPSPSSTASVSASAFPSAAASPSPSALPFTDLPLSSVGFSCRLPIYDRQTDSFISFPSGAVSDDPNGNGGKYFDRAYSKWLPVTRLAVSPDGAGYTYIEMGDAGAFNVHIVAIASGKDISYPESSDGAGMGAQPIIFDYTANGIYLIEAFEHVWAGVWLFQQPSGAIHQVTDVQVPEVSAGSGIIWYGEINPADPNPFSSRSSAGIFPDEVDRLDLKTGARAQWLYRPGTAVEVMGVDVLGRPVIIHTVPGADPGIGQSNFFDHSQSELLLGLDATHQRSIYKGQLVESLSAPIADSHGVWFGSPYGIYLYTSSGSLIKISNHPGYPANGCF